MTSPAKSVPLLARMLELAQPVCRNFLSDLTEHDARTLNSAYDADLFLWAPYASGTLLVRLRYQTEDFDANESWEACNSVMKPKQWYSVCLRTGKVEPVTIAKAEHMIRQCASNANRKFKGY